MQIYFRKTDSYTSKLIEFSVYYKTYSNVLSIRTVAAEYLIAMKLRSGRQYKSDLSDVLGILAEHKKRGTPIIMEQIQKAVTDLYGDWSSLSDMSQTFIENVMADGRFEQLYEQTARGEQETKELLIRFEKDYPGVTKESNVDAIAYNLQKKANKASIIAQLRQRQTKDVETTQRKKPTKMDDLER